MREHRGRDHYPVKRLLFCALLQPLLRHPTMERTLTELRRNAALQRLGGDGRKHNRWFGQRNSNIPGRTTTYRSWDNHST